VNVALLYVFALSSIGVYGVILGGWASNNKYSFLGMLRSSAQLIAYELPLGLGILGVVAASGSLELDAIIRKQADSGVWFAFAQPLGFIVFTVAAFAEAARLPFDLPEAEQELIGGYHTEYSGMKLLLFLVAEFLHMITASFLIVILFLGGWHLWGLTGAGEDEVTWLTAIGRLVVLMVKIFLVILFFMMVRWSWPRFRFDQLMNLAWKVMLPLGMVNLTAVAVFEEMKRGFDASNWILVPAAWIVCIAGWLAVAYAAPLATDNRPRRDLQPHGIDAQI
jgi:NADH-quinone oxidoreductase subunit H